MLAAAAPAAGWAGEQVVSADGGRLGARDRGRPELAVRVPADHPLHGADGVWEQVPASLHHAEGVERRRRHVGPGPLHLHVLARRCTGGPDHRGRPEHGRRVRRVHERLQRGVHEVDRPRRNLVDTGEVPTATSSWNDKPILATSDNGNDVYVSWNGPQNGDPYVAQSHNGGRDMDPDEDRQQHSLLLRLRRRRAAQRHGGVLRDEPRLRRSRRGARRSGAGQRAPLDQQRRVVHGEPRRHRRARARLHRGRMPGRLLPGAHRDHGRYGRDARAALRRRDGLQGKRDDLVPSLDGRRRNVVGAPGVVDGR